MGVWITILTLIHYAWTRFLSVFISSLNKVKLLADLVNIFPYYTNLRLWFRNNAITDLAGSETTTTRC